MLILCVRLGLAGVEHWMLGLAAGAGFRMKLEHWMLVYTGSALHEQSRNFDAAIFWESHYGTNATPFHSGQTLWAKKMY